jgi:hypothetical protein
MNKIYKGSTKKTLAFSALFLAAGALSYLLGLFVWDVGVLFNITLFTIVNSIFICGALIMAVQSLLLQIVINDERIWNADYLNLDGSILLKDMHKIDLINNRLVFAFQTPYEKRECTHVTKIHLYEAATIAELVADLRKILPNVVFGPGLEAFMKSHPVEAIKESK